MTNRTLGAGLWAISCYFNPCRYRRRLANYQGCRRRLTAPLVCVELSFDGRFELGADDADVLIKVKGGAVLWQKERLLNIAWRHVPPQLPQDRLARLRRILRLGRLDRR